MTYDVVVSEAGSGTEALAFCVDFFLESEGDIATCVNPNLVVTLPRRPIRHAARAITSAAVGLSAGALVGWTDAPSAVQCDAAPARAAAYLTANFIADAAEKACPALVHIRVGNGFGQSSGSGFVIDPSGVILTNCHVVRDALTRSGGGRCAVTLYDGTEFQGVVQHADPVSDIAIVKVSATQPLPTVALGSSSGLRVGEFVVALGAPAGLTNSVSAGIVSSVDRTRSDLGLDRRSLIGGQASNHRAAGMHYIQTDAAINQGNSGGPLLNLAGEVIGVNTMKVSGMDGIAFAVPIDEVKRVVVQLTKHGRVLRPYLGIKFVELDAQTKRQLEQSSRASGGTQPPPLPSAGLFVMHVAPDSPAQRAGVRAGDTIVGMGGRSLRTTKELLDGLADRVGQRVQLELQRYEQRLHAECHVESMQQ
ncbi:protease do-like 14-like protein [Chrysochromulina tobinii]|uniref:Protease do-like 14-like protein n=1 Tax=Chrysochromulina tobinii TaxID=1460289 RepID=A0A0M0JAP6_9EUKA|nr:protease do-like 14-like protein [Chrysochromulina tobinii]|eukprot:KOO23427.1 protease do-like 14-like protein [Chrysochromulina sp. CCMP291]